MRLAGRCITLSTGFSPDCTQRNLKKNILLFEKLSAECILVRTTNHICLDETSLGILVRPVEWCLCELSPLIVTLPALSYIV